MINAMRFFVGPKASILGACARMRIMDVASASLWGFVFGVPYCVMSNTLNWSRPLVPRWLRIWTRSDSNFSAGVNKSHTLAQHTVDIQTRGKHHRLGLVSRNATNRRLGGVGWGSASHTAHKDPVLVQTGDLDVVDEGLDIGVEIDVALDLVQNLRPDGNRVDHAVEVGLCGDVSRSPPLGVYSRFVMTKVPFASISAMPIEKL